MRRGRIKPGLCRQARLRERNVNDVILVPGLYRLGDLSVEPDEPDDFPEAPLPVTPDGADDPRAPLAPDPLEDLLLTPKACAVFSSTVPVIVKPSDF